jgi:hypothetical protein
MPTLTSDTGETWTMTDAQAANVRTLASLPPWELTALLKLARSQATLDAALGRPDREPLRVVDGDGALVRVFPCRRRREAEQRDEALPSCRWRRDSAGGYACAECATWAQPDSERAHVLDRLAANLACVPPIIAEDELAIDELVRRKCGPESVSPGVSVDVDDIREEIAHLRCLAANAGDEGGAEARARAKSYLATADRLASALGEPVQPTWTTEELRTAFASTSEWEPSPGQLATWRAAQEQADATGAPVRVSIVGGGPLLDHVMVKPNPYIARGEP